MSIFDNLANSFGYQKKEDKIISDKKAGKPWDDIPEGQMDSFIGEMAPNWKSEDYLKASKSWVYACVSAISDEIASIHLKLYKRKGNELVEIYEHPLLDLLYKVNDFTTKFDHWWLTQDYLELAGEAPWLLERETESGPPTSIYLLRPDKLTIKFDKDKVVGKYIYTVDIANKVEIEPQDLILIKYPNPLTLFRGVGTLEAARQTVDLENYSEQWNLAFMYNSARPDAVLSFKKTLSDEQRKYLYKLWNKSFKGIQKSSKLVILEGEASYQPMQVSAKDMDFLLQQQYSRDKIFSIFRVPKSIVAISDDVNRASAETHSYSFARWTIKPKMIRIVEQLNEFLVPMFGDDLILGFEDPVPENTELKIAKYTAALSPTSGWMSINEVRKQEGLEEVENGDEVIRQSTGGTFGEFNNNNDGTGGKVFQTKKSKPKKDYLSTEVIGLNARKKRRLDKDDKNSGYSIEKIKDGIRSIVKASMVKKSIHTTKKNIIGDKKIFWEKQIAIEERYENDIVDELKLLFKEQESDIIQRIDSYYKDIDIKSEIKIDVSRFLLDVKIEAKKFVKKIKPILKNNLTDVGQYVLDEMKTGVEFDFNKTAESYLNKNVIKFSLYVNRNTNLKIRDVISEGLEKGEGIDKISNKIKNIFDDATSSRSVIIARTETSRVANYATVEAYKQSGVVNEKEWLTAFDEDTCDSCSSMNGKKVGLDENFFEKGDSYKDTEIDYDDVGQPPLHVNCRCTIIPVV
jgi:HK97 family phage portal protein